MTQTGMACRKPLNRPLASKRWRLASSAFSQSFSPLNGRPYLVVVSEDENGCPGEPQVFLAAPHQGVNYRRNTWHHPLMAIGAVCDFLVVDRDGPDNNLEEFFFDTPFVIREPHP